MILRENVDANKLRGGYYTDAHVVDFCIRQILRISSESPKRWLEPSAGDGAFIRGFSNRMGKQDLCGMHLQAVELIESEAAKCESERLRLGIAGEVIQGSFFEWAADSHESFDAVVGNPPYVRYQFVDEMDRALAEQQIGNLDLILRGVSNLWIPFAILSIEKLRVGGCFSLVLPSELFCTSSGGQFRKYLLEKFSSLEIDLFPRGTFSEILQDVVVVSGKRVSRTAAVRPVRFTDHADGTRQSWKHKVAVCSDSWTRFLLTEDELAAFIEAKSLPGFHSLGNMAKIEVAIVTGANKFFTITDSEVEDFKLHPWAVPLLAKTVDSPGVVFSESDFERACGKGSRSWLLDFSAERPPVNGRGRVSEYLKIGLEQGLQDRYKCRIREPWYRVPHIKQGGLMLTKRAHHFHRLLLNSAGVYTTDTIYRGVMNPLYEKRETDLVATFQNTLTLLSTEIEGRTYGGGVLELVPSEVARLSVPLVETNGLINQIDEISRMVDGQQDSSHSVMVVTDKFLCEIVPGYAQLLPRLDAARKRLQSKRQSS